MYVEKRFCAIIFICKVDFYFFFFFFFLRNWHLKHCLLVLPPPPFVCSNKHLEITDIQRFLIFKSSSKHVTLILFIYVYHLSIIFFLFFFNIPKIRIILLKHCTSYQLIDQSLSHSTKSQTINTFRSSFHSFFFSFSFFI